MRVAVMLMRITMKSSIKHILTHTELGQTYYIHHKITDVFQSKNLIAFFFSAIPQFTEAV